MGLRINCVLLVVGEWLTHISSIGSQNLTVNFTKTTFCQIPNAWPTFCKILVALDQLEPPKKASIMLQNIASMKYTIILVLILPRFDVLP